MVDKTSLAVALKPDKTSSILVCGVKCFSRMLISNVHKSIIVMNSIDPRSSRNVFEAVQNLAARFLSGLKPLGSASWLKIPIKPDARVLNITVAEFSTVECLHWPDKYTSEF